MLTACFLALSILHCTNSTNEEALMKLRAMVAVGIGGAVAAGSMIAFAARPLHQGVDAENMRYAQGNLPHVIQSGACCPVARPRRGTLARASLASPHR